MFPRNVEKYEKMMTMTMSASSSSRQKLVFGQKKSDQRDGTLTTSFFLKDMV